jgi:3D (Asp-Asp-Asp) domain-containing protein
MRLLARSIWLKGMVTTVAAGSFVWLYEVRFLDSKYAILPFGSQTVDTGQPPAPGVRLTFSATAYCKGLVTNAGVAVQRGIVAADPALLPIGSVLNVDASDFRYDGIYTVLDTGPQVRGREVDIFMWSCTDAISFGRRPVQLTLLRVGWNPQATTPRLSDSLFKRPQSQQPLPARPLPIIPSEPPK